MPSKAVRARRLGTAALGAVAFFFLFAVQVPLFFRHFPHRPAIADLFNYLAAAHVGLEHGWSRIYDPALQAPAYMAVSGSGKFEWLNLFVSPPPVAWVVVPFTVLPVVLAYWAWVGVSLAALAVAAWRVAPWRGPGRLVALLVGFGTYPVLIALQFGQITPLLAAAVALGWERLQRDREIAAGLLLVPLALKPQVGVFVPFALLLAGYRRTFLLWLAGAAVLAVASIATLGAPGLSDLLRDLAEEQRHLDNEVWTLAWLVGVGPFTILLEAACVAGALVVGWLVRGRRAPALPVVAGTLGSLLGAGYHHSIDFPSLLVLALVQLHTLRGWAAAALVTAGIVASILVPRFGPGPLLVFLMAWLAATIAMAFRVRHPARARADVAAVSAA